MDESESDAQGDDVAGGLYDSSLGQVVDIAERYLDLARSGHIDLGLTLDELVQEGNTVLLLAIERFEPQGGSTFSTYAARWIRLAMFRAVLQDALRNDASAPGPQARIGQLVSIQEFREECDRLLELLDGRERALLHLRFGMGRGEEPRTLADVSEQWHWSRERVRQVEARALSKIRHFEMPDVSIAADRFMRDGTR